MQLRNIAGGLIWAKLVNEIRDGELTISSPLNVLTTKIQEAKIHQQIFGSDHCPVELDIDL